MDTPEELISFLSERSREEWEKNSFPYLLARVGPDLRDRGEDYRLIIGEDRTLKQFVAASDQLKLVQHPRQKAKIGIIPAQEEFEFPAEGLEHNVSPPGKNAVASSRSRSRHQVIGFIGSPCRIRRGRIGSHTNSRIRDRQADGWKVTVSVVIATHYDENLQLVGSKKSSIIPPEISKKFTDRGENISVTSLLVQPSFPDLALDFFLDIPQHVKWSCCVL